MKIVIRSLLFHIFCILSFGYIYFYNSSNFNSINKYKNRDIIDYFLLSTSIQAGVGISVLYPISRYSKILMIIQQIMMISTHVITIYFFTI
jgi:hypothetical protein